MRTLTYHEFMADLLSFNAGDVLKTAGADRKEEGVALALAYNSRAYQIDPKSDMAVLGLMLDYLRASEIEDNKFGNYRPDANFDAAKADMDKAVFWRTKATEMGADWQTLASENYQPTNDPYAPPQKD